jgi:ArsR family transcriptional regulator, arsenate/arsenite/antimonite-responsive transcriptional repressor
MNTNIVLALKAIADPVRYEIIQQLKQHNELCACHLLATFSITQPTLSFHMKKLVESHLVKARKEGTWMKYSLNESIMEEISLALRLDDQKDDIACACQS